MFRAYTLCFWGTPRTDYAKKAHESSPLMYVPLCILAGLSLIVGWLEIPAVFGHVEKISEWVRGAWSSHATTEVAHLSHSVEWGLMLFTSVASISVAFFAFKKLQVSPEFSLFPGPVVKVTQAKFWVDEIYQKILVRPVLAVGKFFAKQIDEILLNGGSEGLFNVFKLNGEVLSLFHTGSVQSYAWHFIFWAAVLTGVALVWM